MVLKQHIEGMLPYTLYRIAEEVAQRRVVLETQKYTSSDVWILKSIFAKWSGTERGHCQS